jgi:hypothetical protein
MFPSDQVRPAGGLRTRADWRDHAEHVGRRIDKLAAEFDAKRAARLTGRKSLVRRLLDRLRARHLRGDPQSNCGTFNDPGRLPVQDGTSAWYLRPRRQFLAG